MLAERNGYNWEFLLLSTKEVLIINTYLFCTVIFLYIYIYIYIYIYLFAIIHKLFEAFVSL